MAGKLEDWIQWPEVEALVYAECKRPETVLGSRKVDSSHVLITTFQKDVDSVTVKLTASNKTYKMELLDEAGITPCLFQQKKSHPIALS